MTGDDISIWFKGPTEVKPNWEGGKIESTLMSAVYEDCCEILGNSPTGSDVCEAVAVAAATAEQVWNELEGESPAYACANGCAWCCHQTVMVIAPEVIFIADYIDRSFGTTGRDELRARIGRQKKFIERRTTAERQMNGLACGALADAACSVHPVRPLLCRGGFSSDERFCFDLFEDFSGVIAALDNGTLKEAFLGTPKILFDSAQAGLWKAFHDLGYKCQPLELTAALDIALSIRDAGDAWLVDECIFSPAVLTKVGEDYVTSAT